MKKVLIFGVGSGTERIIRILKSDIEIVAFVDNDKIKQGKCFMGKNIISPNDICRTYYDYIMIGSIFFNQINKQLLDLNINKEKIVQFYKYGINEVEHMLTNINNKVKVIATGLSYMYYALDINEMKKETANLASSSQDLYYDFNVVKYILELNLYKPKYVIIGLSYFSFHWDISKSSLDYMCVKYRAISKQSHNSENYEVNNKEYDCFLKQSQELLLMDFNNIVVKDMFSNSWNTILDEKNKKLGESQAQIHNKKIYKSTVEENIKILKEYLKLLKNYSIKPILVVCPTSKYYYNYFPDRLKNEFYSIINFISKDYEFQFIDYFYSNKFEENDFADPSHLNKNGAKKFTEIMNKDIYW